MMHIDRYIRIPSDDAIRTPLSVSRITIQQTDGSTSIVYAVDLGTRSVELLSMHDAMALYDALSQILDTDPQANAQP